MSPFAFEVITLGFRAVIVFVPDITGTVIKISLVKFTHF